MKEKKIKTSITIYPSHIKLLEEISQGSETHKGSASKGLEMLCNTRGIKKKVRDVYKNVKKLYEYVKKINKKLAQSVTK